MLYPKEIRKKLSCSFRSFIKRFLLINEAIKNSHQDSYFFEENRKSRTAIIFDNILHLIKYGEVNVFYFLYGLDRVDSNNGEYLDYRSFMISRNIKNKIGTATSQVILLRDKFLFYKYLSGVGISTPEIFAFEKGGTTFDDKLEVINMELLQPDDGYFAKDNGGECASYVRRIKKGSKFTFDGNVYPEKGIIFQKALKQSDELSLLNPSCLNTLRVVTINKDGAYYVLAAVLRIGTKATGNVDNWAAGGIAVAIDENGRLNKYAFYKPGYGNKVSKHPDTGIVFEEFIISHYTDAINLALKAHSKFYGIHSIGWDIAFTNDGPTIIEGNDNWEISLMQLCGPLKKQWINACK